MSRKVGAFYDRLSQIDGGPRTDRLAAVARRRVADIDARLGDLAAADAAYTDASGQLRQLAADDATWTEAGREAAVSATDHGHLLRTLDRPDDAGRQHAAASAGFRTRTAAGSDLRTFVAGGSPSSSRRPGGVARDACR